MNTLDAYIKTHKTYLMKRLTLPKLSSLTKILAHHISQIVNEHKNLNFQDYLNQFRVEEAKTLLNSQYSNNYTFDTLASDIGFNSSTSFYRAFKKFTNLTTKAIS